MIKIENLSKDARVLVTRNGKVGQVFVGQLISHKDWQTVDVQAGEVTFSIDEQVVKTKVATIKNAEIKTAELKTEAVKVEDSVSVVEAVEAAPEPEAAAAPKTAAPKHPKLVNMKNAIIKK